MDLTFINEYVTESNELVIDSIDRMYVKQQSIMEFSEEVDLLSKYECFQEGYAKPASSPELDVFKFDNKHILKAIKYFNKAYAEIPFETTNFDEIKEKQERGELSLKSSYAPEIEYSPEFVNQIEKLFRNPNGYLEKGFQELQKQFDCRFSIYISQKTGTGTIITNFPTNPGSLTVSRSKGFQLGGLSITINLNMRQLLTMVPSNKSLFGQSLTSVLLHEIYHNIVHMIGVRNKKLHDEINSTVVKMKNASSLDSIKARVSAFINKFKSSFNINDNEINEERVARRMYVLSQIQDNPGAVKKFENDIKNNADQTNTEEEIDRYVKGLKMVKDLVIIKRGMRVVSAACCILLAGLGFAFGSTAAVVGGVVGIAVMSLSMLKKKVLSLFGVSVRVQEEYFCDLFASMYKLPIHLSSFNRQIKLNQMNANKMTEIRKLDQKISKGVKDPHPTNFDRELTSYKVAKQLLESGQKLKKPEREYLQYIVNLHEGIEDINNPYSKTQAKKLDPEAAKDLQQTLRDFVNRSGATITESGDGYGS